MAAPMASGVMKLVNKLQEACTVLGDTAGGSGAAGLPSLWDALPSIVVVGGQSSGKSSVLESVVGEDFLPRGSGIVTRRPLVLQLVTIEEGEAPYGVFLHKRDARFPLDRISNEISAETHRTVGARSVSPEPIQLTVYGPQVPNLTLVDLPGLTKIPIDGQPKSIVKDIEDMARKYIEGRNAIILAVTPANADLATSDALRIAKEVDPGGKRTIGVLTKIDLMDRGTDASAILSGRVGQLRNGWLGVVNRSQAEIDGQKSMAATRHSEMEFFQGHPAYRGLKNVGTDELSRRLGGFLETTIREQIPSIQAFVADGIKSLQRELDDLGAPVVQGRGQMLFLILESCRKFDSLYKTALDSGKGGGETILTVFDKKLKEYISARPFKEVFSLSNVAQTITEADGYQPHLIAPEMGYRRLIEQGVSLLNEPARRCVDDVHGILSALVEREIEKDTSLAQFAGLQREMRKTALEALEEFREGAHKMVGTIVDMEKSFLTAEFFRQLESAEAHSAPAPAMAFEGATKGGGSARDGVEDAEKAHVRKIGSHCSAYVKQVCLTARNSIPKACVHCQVVKAKRTLLEGLVTRCTEMDEAELSKLLEEDERVAARRAQCNNRLELLRRARAELTATL